MFLFFQEILFPPLGFQTGVALMLIVFREADPEFASTTPDDDDNEI